MGPGSIAFFASNDEHGMFNIGDVSATYHVLRWISPRHRKPRKNPENRIREFRIQKPEGPNLSP